MKSFLPVILLSLVFAACASKNTDSSAPKMEGSKPAITVTTEETKTNSEAKTEKKAKKAKVARPESAATTAASAEKSSADEVSCKSGTDERKLAIVGKDAGCELHYTKAGATSTIASQIIGNAKCNSVMTSVKEKLIASGFNCQ